ncbi:unnamed protein product [Didymodactylos carnosus]|uniref:Uncharacterized protein n=1 Tax=Didymodactylos carnosus TaxID=1234261 RepID=A0A8S2FJQ6_9BILA|nr:unnamed protein product [Didymodactylos carnosus]CAF4277949.1 unnamed protein product [Didymodactylos carnosus]
MENSKQTLSTDMYASNCTTTTTAVTIRSLESFVLVWLDRNMDKTDDNLKSKRQLRRIVNCLKTFDNADRCINYILDIKDEQIFLIVSGSLAEQIVPLIEQVPQLQ